MNFVLIDGSYFCFYRFYALHTWWKNAKPDNQLDKPIDSPVFVEKFRKTFISKIQDIPKQLKIPDAIVLVGKDCPRQEIWRNKYYKEYKANREYDDSFMGGPFFAMAYDSLFKEAGVSAILEHDELEADDCIAMTAKHITNLYEEAHVWIIGNDHDYLQLLGDRIHLYDLKFNNLAQNKNCTGCPQKDLFCKIVMGDKSDNIPAIFPKCGKKTAIKCYEDPEFFQSKMESEEVREAYELNKKIIDFNEIPEDLVNSFRDKMFEIVNNFIVRYHTVCKNCLNGKISHC